MSTGRVLSEPGPPEPDGVALAAAAAALAAAAAALARDEVVAIPTDTVYGLAARASSPRGCQAIFCLKCRPPTVGLPVLVGDQATALALAAPGAREALEVVGRALWPGPLTIVVEAAPPKPVHLGGDGGSIGLRLADDTLVRALASLAGPLAVTSANRHGQRACTTAGEVEAAFPEGLAAIVDGGRRDGQPSSVVSLVGPRPTLLREGPVSRSAVERALSSIRQREEPN